MAVSAVAAEVLAVVAVVVSAAVVARLSVDVVAQEVDSAAEEVAVVSNLVEARVASAEEEAAEEVAVAVVATKRRPCYKSAKHVGVNRQWRIGVNGPRTAWEMVSMEALFHKRGSPCHGLRCTGLFEYREEAKKRAEFGVPDDYCVVKRQLQL